MSCRCNRWSIFMKFEGWILHFEINKLGAKPSWILLTLWLPLSVPCCYFIRTWFQAWLLLLPRFIESFHWLLSSHFPRQLNYIFKSWCRLIWTMKGNLLWVFVVNKSWEIERFIMNFLLFPQFAWCSGGIMSRKTSSEQLVWKKLCFEFFHS